MFTLHILRPTRARNLYFRLLFTTEHTIENPFVRVTNIADCDVVVYHLHRVWIQQYISVI